MVDVLKYSVGIDVANKKFDASFGEFHSTFNHVTSKSRQFTNNLNGFNQLEKWISKKRKNPNIPLILVMEATGVYYEQLAYYLQEKGYHVCVLLPSLAAHYLKSQGLRSKNDSIDAKGLTLIGLEKKLRLWSPPSALMRKLRALTRHRENVLQMITMVNNQLHAHKRSAFPSTEVKRHLKKMITGFKAQVAELNIQIDQTIAEDPVVERKVDNIVSSIKGIGVLTVATLIAETNQFLNFPKTQQLVKFAGYDVIEHQSGSLKGKERISKRGNYRIRRILHLPALNVVAYQTGDFPQFYQRIYDRNKIKMKGYVAVQRKLLCLICTLWKNDQKFDPHFKNSLDKRPVESAELQSV